MPHANLILGFFFSRIKFLALTFSNIQSVENEMWNGRDVKYTGPEMRLTGSCPGLRSAKCCFDGDGLALQRGKEEMKMFSESSWGAYAAQVVSLAGPSAG